MSCEQVSMFNRVATFPSAHLDHPDDRTYRDMVREMLFAEFTDFHAVIPMELYMIFRVLTMLKREE